MSKMSLFSLSVPLSVCNSSSPLSRFIRPTLALALPFVLSLPVTAATLVVDSMDDTMLTDGKCTLRSALEAFETKQNVYSCINRSSHGYGTNDTLRFADHFAGQAIRPTQTIEIKSSLIIDGATSSGARITLDGGHDPNEPQSGIQIIKTEKALVLRNINLQNGYSFGDGGAVAVDFDSLTISNSSFTNNHAGPGGSGSGGAVAVNGGPLRVSNSTFIGNTAAIHGGAIYGNNSENMIVNYTSFIGNTARSSGQAIFSGTRYFQSNDSITNSLFTTDPSNGDDKAHCFAAFKSSFAAGAGNIERYEDQTTGASVSGVSDRLTCGLDSVDITATLLDQPLITTLTPVSRDGVVRYYEPQPNSPAVDHGNPKYNENVANLGWPLRYDQRGPGYPRMQGGKPDTGAIEVSFGEREQWLFEDFRGSNNALNADFVVWPLGDLAGQTCHIFVGVGLPSLGLIATYANDDWQLYTGGTPSAYYSGSCEHVRISLGQEINIADPVFSGLSAIAGYGVGSTVEAAFDDMLLRGIGDVVWTRP